MHILKILSFWVTSGNRSLQGNLLLPSIKELTTFLLATHIKHLKALKVKSLSCVQLFATPWTIAYQGPLSTGFSRQEYWSGLQFPSPGNLPNQGIEPGSPSFQADALPSEPPGKP